MSGPGRKDNSPSDTPARRNCQPEAVLSGCANRAIPLFVLAGRAAGGVGFAPPLVPRTDAPTPFDELATVPDPRSRHGQRHPLSAILGMVALAMPTGRTRLAGTARFGRDHTPALAAAAGAGCHDGGRGARTGGSADAVDHVRPHRRVEVAGATARDRMAARAAGEGDGRSGGVVRHHQFAAGRGGSGTPAGVRAGPRGDREPTARRAGRDARRGRPPGADGVRPPGAGGAAECRQHRLAGVPADRHPAALEHLQANPDLAHKLIDIPTNPITEWPWGNRHSFACPARLCFPHNTREGHGHDEGRSRRRAGRDRHAA